MRYDIRKPARDGIAQYTWQQISGAPALDVPTYKILIISKAFPWSFIIHAPAGSVVTCGTIFEELHKQLQSHIEAVEWATVDKTRKEAIKKAAESRKEKDKDPQLKRIDWLGNMTMFEGLEKDKEFETERYLPGSASDSSLGTWVVRFGKR
jgi:hypothetical protein